MNEKILIYPYDRHFLPIIKYQAHPTNWQICKLVSPLGWGLNGKDAGSVDFDEPLGIIIESDFTKCLTECSAVFFTQSEMQLDFEKFIKPKILKAVKSNKNIYTNITLSDEQYNEFSNICRESNVQFKYYCNSFEKKCINDYDPDYRIETPIVTIMGMLEGINKFEVQLLLHKFFTEQGYNSVLVSSRNYSMQNSCFPIPAFMFDNTCSEIEKILSFKKFIIDIEKKYRPDVIIIGIPGGIIPFDDVDHNGFGVTAFEITRAIKPDATVLCTYTENFSSTHWEHIKNICRFRFSSEITVAVRYNMLLVFSGLGSSDESKFLLFDPKEKDFPITSAIPEMINRSESQQMCEIILNTLAENATSESF